MPAQSKQFDVTHGIGSHGSLCCPHILVGIRITGSPNVMTNTLPTSRAYIDFGYHNCPHCGVNITIMGSPNTFVNTLPAHRKNDAISEICGSGITVTGSPNVFTNGIG